MFFFSWIDFVYDIHNISVYQYRQQLLFQGTEFPDSMGKGEEGEGGGECKIWNFFARIAEVGIFRVGVFQVEIFLGGNFPGGNYPRWESSGWEFSRWEFFGWELFSYL